MQFEKINNIIKTSPSKLIFKQDELQWLEERITLENETAFTTCIIREKKVKLTPEEVIRQLYTNRLIQTYKYPKNLINFEVNISFGREKKRADVVVYKDDKFTPYIVVELKEPKQENNMPQMKSYLNAQGAEVGIATNGINESVIYRPYPKDFAYLPYVPEYRENPESVYDKRITLNKLEYPENLKNTIKELDDMVLANSGFDSFEEIFKLIYAKIYDEIQAGKDKEYNLNFRASKDEKITRDRIVELFKKANKQYTGIFNPYDTILLRPSHLKNIVAKLEKYKLMGSDLQIIDDAFEYLIPDVAKSKKGQYFTPRHVIDMCVKMLNPKDGEFVIDPACGSAGFLIHTMQYVQKKYNKNETTIKDYAEKYLWGIDFDEKSSRISKALMLIAGDGKSHIFKDNTLDTSSWDSRIKNDFDDEGLSEGEEFKNFKFDVLLANPPFSGIIREEHILQQYELAENKQTISREILFIERNLQFIKKGGRLAIVLPQGIFNNSSAQYIREFFSEKARILGVVSLAVNTFKPHTGTKTSVLFLQKWDDTLCPRKDDYNIFFAVSEKSGKDNSGNYIKLTNDEGEETITDHDLYEVKGQKGIAEEFIEFCKKEGLSFHSD